MVDLNKHNWKMAIKLDVQDSQKHFIASNIHSITESTFYEGTLLKCFMKDGIMVGFSLCYLPHETNDIGHIVRFMIDKNHQKMGYGKQAIRLLIKMFKEDYSTSKVTLTVVPENMDARSFYESVGFENTNEMEDGELKYVYTV